MDAIVIAALAAVSAGFAAIAQRTSRIRSKEWEAASRELRLDHISPSFFKRDALAGTIDAFAVDVHPASDSAFHAPGAGSIFATIDTRGQIPIELAIEPKRSHVLSGAFDRGVVATGDAKFDQQIRVIGGEQKSLAALDRRSRQLVLDATDAFDLRVAGGIVIGRLLGDAPTMVTVGPSQARLVRLVRAMLRVARALSVDKHASIGTRLFANLEIEDEPGAGARTYDLLARNPETVERALSIALAHRLPQLRHRAASVVKNRDVLIALVKDVRVADALRASSLEQAAGMPARELLALIPGAGSKLAAMIAAALRAEVSEEGESALIAMLEHDEDDVVIAAAGSLGVTGTARAVAPLQRASGGLLGSTARKRAVASAVQAIQQRLVGAGGGQLSLVDGDRIGGELSVAGDGGALSIKED